MIKYTINEDKILSYSKEINIHSNRFYIYLSIILIIVWVIMFIVGLATKNNNLMYLSLGFFLLELLYLFLMYLSQKKILRNIEKSFLEIYPSGEQIIELSKTYDELIIHDIILNTISKIKVCDIKKTIKLKTCVLYKLVDKTYVYFPLNESVSKELGL